MSKRSCIFITVTMQIRTFSLNLGTSNKNFGTTRYFRERSWWIRITPIKFFRNFSKKYCVLMLMKLSTKEVIYILKSYAYLEHLVKIMFTLNQPMETKAIISNILFVLIVINNSWNFFLTLLCLTLAVPITIRAYFIHLLCGVQEPKYRPANRHERPNFIFCRSRTPCYHRSDWSFFLNNWKRLH